MIMQMSQKVVGNVELQNIVVKRVTRYNIVLNEYLPDKSKMSQNLLLTSSMQRNQKLYQISRHQKSYHCTSRKTSQC